MELCCIIIFLICIIRIIYIYKKKSKYTKQTIKSLTGHYYQNVGGGIGNKLMAVANLLIIAKLNKRNPHCIIFYLLLLVKGWNNFNKMYEVDEYENLTSNSIKYDSSKSIQLCILKDHIILQTFFSRKEDSIYISYMWCELMKYIVEIDIMYEKLKAIKILKQSKKQEKNKQILESYYEIFKLIKVKNEINDIVSNFLFSIDNFLSIQIREGSCDFNQNRKLLRYEDINEFILLAKKLTIKYNIKKWFVASDCIKLKYKIIKESNGMAFIYLKNRVRFSEDDEITAAIELEILSRGSYFIITNQSSYSIVSLYKSGKCIDINNNPDCVKTIGNILKYQGIHYFNKL